MAKKVSDTTKAPKPADERPVVPKKPRIKSEKEFKIKDIKPKRTLCKFCGEDVSKVEKEVKTVKMYDSNNKLIKPEKGFKFECWIKKCPKCENIIRFGTPKLVSKD